MTSPNQLYLISPDVQAIHEIVRYPDVPLVDKPLNRLVHRGEKALSSIELLALVVGGKDALTIASRIIESGQSLGGIAKLSLDELQEIEGVGLTLAARLKAAAEMGIRMGMLFPEERPQVRTPGDVANLVMLEMGVLEQEHLRVVLLDTKSFVIRVVTVYVGSLNTAVVRIAEVFREAIRTNSASLVVIHNHPSGDPTPSPEDVRVTELIVEAGSLLSIDVLDHLVIGRNRYISMKERGLGFR